MTTPIAVIPIEGVLSRGHDLKSAQPQRWARTLFDALHSQYRMIGLTQADSDLADWWLRREMLRDWAGVMSQPDAFKSTEEWKVHQVEEFLAEGWEVGVMVDTDQDVLTEVGRLGVVTMFLRYPANKVGWRDPDQPLRGWEDVVQSL
jgi:hypothetical protein